MNYVVVTNEWLSKHGIMPLSTMRKSKDGGKILMHEDYLTPYLQQEESEVDTEKPNGWLPPELYPHNSQKLKDLLASEEWSYSEEDAPTESADFIQVAAVRNLMTATKAGIQTYALSAKEALEVKGLYPDWKVGIDVKVGERYNCDDNLWEVVQEHTTQENWKPSMETLSLWKKVQTEHEGTEDDPIPFEQGMNIEQGKYYEQFGVVYKAIQNANAVVYDLKDIPAIVEPV